MRELWKKTEKYRTEGKGKIEWKSVQECADMKDWQEMELESHAH